MGRTNQVATLYTKSRDWQGALTKTELGDYNVWFEQHNTLFVDDVGRQVKQKALIILYSEINLDDVSVSCMDREYEVYAWDAYYDSQGNYHHTEAVLI